VDEIHVMRKTVIDGSNTTGFQRTSVIALGGEISIERKRIPIQHVGLEEDAARKTGEEGSTIRYRIDRLGVPLIEIATAPVLYSPEEAEKVALAIGRILRATRRVKRGLGTIRQDLNVSISGGALIEIKGVQELRLVSTAIEHEVQRQLNLLEIRDELKRRGLSKEDIGDEFIDVASVLKQAKCRVVQKAIHQKNPVLAVKLPMFDGLLKRETAPGTRLGTEMAERAHFWGRTGGIFHTDELPAYGISSEEVDKIRRFMGAEPKDAIVLVADALENATDALKAVAERAREAVQGVPEETRAAKTDGTTQYMRPRPGAARMYPETDVPPIRVTREYLGELRSRLPELPEQKMDRLMRQYGLNPKLAGQILDSEHGDLFEEIAQRTRVTPTVITVALTETMRALKREGVETEKVPDEQIKDLFSLIDSEKIAKEAIPDVLRWLATHEGLSTEEAIEKLGLTAIPQGDLEKIIEDAMEENYALIRKMGKAAFGPLMGAVMKRVKGRAKAEAVSEILKKKLEGLKG